MSIFKSIKGTEGFHSRDLYTKANYFEGVATQEKNDSGSKRLFALFLFPGGGGPHNSKEAVMNIVAHILAKFEYFKKQIIFSNYLAHKL